MAMAAGAGGGAGHAVEGDGDGVPNKLMSFWERAPLAPAQQLEPALKCPRCDSTNTKFCYFNNYSLSQPRHFCRACRRYWTRGGALRNFPVGGERRHSKRGAKAEPASGEAGEMSSTTSMTSSTATTCTDIATTAVAAGMQQ